MLNAPIMSKIQPASEPPEVAPVIQVAIVEDSDGLRESLVVLLNGTPGFQCAGAYSSAESALAEIPENLGISYDTVHWHIRNIYQKLHVRSRAQAVAKHPRVGPAR